MTDDPRLMGVAWYPLTKFVIAKPVKAEAIPLAPHFRNDDYPKSLLLKLQERIEHLVACAYGFGVGLIAPLHHDELSE